MADPVASVQKIVKLGLAIKRVVDTARHNEEECREIGKRVLRFSAILSQLQQAGLMNNSPAMSGALEDLEETLEHALLLVNECQERHIVRRFLGARDLAKQLRRVKDDILNKVMLATFAINTHNTFELFTIQQAAGHPPPRVPEVTGAVDIPHNSHPANDARSELDGGENNILGGGEASFAPLVALRNFPLSELEAAITGVPIGSGAACDVYKGILNDGNVVAIKKFRSSHHLGEFRRGGARTYDPLLASKLRHKNIVKVLGYGHHEVRSSPVMRSFKGKNNQVKYIWVEEYMPNGSLDKIITESQLDWSSDFRIIEGLAQGVHYLHEQRIVHMDVKPSNVLLDSDMNPKITDFELSILLGEYDDSETEGISGTVGYLDPEYFRYGIATMKNDVYGFGITLLETVRGLHTSKPRSGCPYDRWAWEAWEAGRMEEVFDPSLFDRSQLMEIKRCLVVGLLCAQSRQADRPTMADVIEMLNGKEELPTPKKPWYMAGPSFWSDVSISPL